MDELDQGLDQSTEPEAPAAKPEFDLQTVLSGLTSEFDKRFSGIQSATDRRMTELQKTIEELRAANLTPEEQEQLEIKQARERASALERENALLKMRKHYPEEVDFLENFFGAKNLEEQLTALSAFRKPVETPTAPETQTTATPVSGNNTPRRAIPSIVDTGVEMSDELADQIIGSAGNERGILSRLLKR